MNSKIWNELEDFANKASGDRKTRVATCLITASGQTIFGANHLRDNHGLTAREINDRIRPTFYDAMKCAEADAVDKAEELGLNLSEAQIYSLRFPCPDCAKKISKTKIKYVIARNHKVGSDTKIGSSLQDSVDIFNKAGVVFDIGKPIGQ